MIRFKVLMEILLQVQSSEGASLYGKSDSLADVDIKKSQLYVFFLLLEHLHCICVCELHALRSL